MMIICPTCGAKWSSVAGSMCVNCNEHLGENAIGCWFIQHGAINDDDVSSLCGEDAGEHGLCAHHESYCNTIGWPPSPKSVVNKVTDNLRDALKDDE